MRVHATIDVFHLLIKVRLFPLNVHRLRETICPMTCARARAWKSVGLFWQRNKRYSLSLGLKRFTLFLAKSQLSLLSYFPVLTFRLLSQI